MAHSIARATLGLTKPAQIDPLKVPSFFSLFLLFFYVIVNVSGFVIRSVFNLCLKIVVHRFFPF